MDLITCSICLRVRCGSEWLEAERVINDTTSYEGELPRLHSAVCDDCAKRSFVAAQTAGTHWRRSALSEGQLPTDRRSYDRPIHLHRNQPTQRREA
jgi:hypothetical protein